MKPKGKRKSYLPQYHTKERREYIDFDYLHKLSPEDLDWLARFIDEEYGASFDINPIYVKISDLPTNLLDQVSNNIVHDSQYVQVYKNKKKGQVNLDLRKIRSLPKYYKTPEGKYTQDERFKYSSKNINDPSTKEKRERFNKRVRDMRNDLYGMGLKDRVDTRIDLCDDTNLGQKRTAHTILDTFDHELSYEDKIILIADREQEED